MFYCSVKGLYQELTVGLMTRNILIENFTTVKVSGSGLWSFSNFGYYVGNILTADEVIFNGALWDEIQKSGQNPKFENSKT